MALTHGWRVPVTALAVGDEVYAALDAPKLTIQEIGPTLSDSRFRPAVVLMDGRSVQVGMHINMSYLVATREEMVAIVARADNA